MKILNLKKEKKIKNKLKIHNNYLINLLFNSKNLFGEKIINTKKDIIPYIYGIRHNYTIINLKIVSLYLKRVLKLIQILIKKNKKILIIGNNEDINFLLNNKFIKNNNNIYYFKEEWVNGLLTNNLIKKKDKKLYYYLIKKKINLLIVFKKSIDDIFFSKELSFLKIPIISLISTSQNILNINYPIVSNLKNIKSIYSLMYLFRKTF